MSEVDFCPADIHFLIHCHWHTDIYPAFESETAQRSIRRLKQCGLIVCKCDYSADIYHVTEKGQVFIDHLCDTPLPKQEWVRGT
jgi:hypothetical protein